MRSSVADTCGRQGGRFPCDRFGSSLPAPQCDPPGHRCASAAEPQPSLPPTVPPAPTPPSPTRTAFPSSCTRPPSWGLCPAPTPLPCSPSSAPDRAAAPRACRLVALLHDPALFDYRLHISHASAFAVQLAPSDRGPLHSTHALPRYATCNLPATALACAPWREPRNQIARFDLAGVPIPPISTMPTTRMQLAHSRLSLYTGMTPHPARRISDLVRGDSARARAAARYLPKWRGTRWEPSSSPQV